MSHTQDIGEKFHNCCNLNLARIYINLFTLAKLIFCDVFIQEHRGRLLVIEEGQFKLTSRQCNCMGMDRYTVLCDQIIQKGSYTCTVSRHNFHCHLLATSMHQHHMCLILLKVEQSACTQGLFLKPVWRPRVLGRPLNGPIFPWQETADCESPYDWLMSLAMDLVALCYMWSSLASMEVFYLFLVKA